MLTPAAVLVATLAGCGLGETASTTAALGEARAEEARAALETQARFEDQLNAAQDAAAAQRAAMEAATE